MAIRCSSVYSRLVLNGFLPNRKGYSGQYVDAHSVISFTCPQQQSRHLARMALTGLRGSFGAAGVWRASGWSTGVWRVSGWDTGVWRASGWSTEMCGTVVRGAVGWGAFFSVEAVCGLLICIVASMISPTFLLLFPQSHALAPFPSRTCVYASAGSHLVQLITLRSTHNVRLARYSAIVPRSAHNAWTVHNARSARYTALCTIQCM